MDVKKLLIRGLSVLGAAAGVVTCWIVKDRIDAKKAISCNDNDYETDAEYSETETTEE